MKQKKIIMTWHYMFNVITNKFVKALELGDVT